MTKKSSAKQTLSIIIGAVIFLAALSQVLAYYFNIPSISVLNFFSNKTNSEPICNTTAPTRPSYSLTFYSQGDVFCIPQNQIIASNITVPTGQDGITGISVSGSYSASTNTEFYILNSVQYGEFLVLKDKIKNYTYYSGNNGGTVINVAYLPSGDTYYIVFYTNSSSLDTIIIERSINASYIFN